MDRERRSTTETKPHKRTRTTNAKSGFTPVHDPKLDSYSTLEISLNDAIVGKRTTIKIKPANPKLSNKTRSQRIVIPPMCYEGQHIKLDKKGRISSNGQRIGHLFLRIKFAKTRNTKSMGFTYTIASVSSPGMPLRVHAFHYRHQAVRRN